MEELSVERIKAGDEKELRQLFEMLLPRIRFWASQQMLPHSEVSADDVVQEVLYKIYSNLHKLTPNNAPDNKALMHWCRLVTLNVARDAWRKQRSRREENIEDIDEEKLPTVEIDSIRVLEEAIQLLPEDEKRIILLWVAGKTLREIAHELDISLSVASKRLKHGQKTLVSLVLPNAEDVLKEVG